MKHSSETQLFMTHGSLLLLLVSGMMNNYKVLVILPTACVPLSVNESRNRNELATVGPTNKQ